MTGNVFKGLKSTIDCVKNLLLDNPELRDCDFLLVAEFWKMELKSKDYDIEKMSLKQFLELFSKNTFTPSKTIERNRRLLQKNNKNLRGDKYKLRHEEEKDVRSNIHSL